MIDWKLKGMTRVPRFNNVYKGRVAANNDPKQQGRIKATIPSVLGPQTISVWALPKNMYSGAATGNFEVPDLGSTVWIEFEDGNISSPIYSSGWPIAPAGAGGYQIPPEAKEDYPNTKVVSYGGHKFIYRKSKNNTSLTIESATGHTISFDDTNNNVMVQSTSGAQVMLDGKTNSATVKANAIGVGDNYGNMSANNAAITKADITAFNASLDTKTLQTLISYTNTLNNAGVFANGSGVPGIIAQLVSGYLGTTPIPNGSAITRIK